MKRALLFLLLTMGCTASGSGVKGEVGLRPFGPAGMTATDRPRRLALLIGIASFDDARFGRLNYPQDDALALAAALSREGFDEVQVLSAREETSRAAVLDALDRLSDKIRTPEDTVLVYISSHGTLAHPSGQPLARFLVMRDTRMSLVTDTGLSVRSLLSRVDEMPSARKAVVLATCHSGTGKSALSDPLVDALEGTKNVMLPDLLEVSEATVVISAAAFGETARESAELGHDIYTYFLIEALSVADRNQDGAVTVSEAHDHAREQTYLYSRGTQRPALTGTILGSDPLILAGQRLRVPQPILFSYSPAADGLSVVVDGIAKGSLPGSIAVSPGRREIAIVDRSGDTLWSGEVEMTSGRAQDIADLIPPPASFTSALEAHSFILLDDATREGAFPPVFGGGVQVRAYDLLTGGLVLGAGINVGVGSNRLLDGSQRVTTGSLVGEVGRSWTWGPLTMVPSLRLGVLVAHRSSDVLTTPIDETLSGFSFGAGLSVETSVGALWSVGARFEGGGLAASIFGRDLHPTAGVALWLGLSPAP